MAYEDIADSLQEEESSTIALTKSLQNLIKEEEKTEAQKSAILGIVEELNERLPELALHA